jgi:peptide/nickel transport system substrate-binding protein
MSQTRGGLTVLAAALLLLACAPQQTEPTRQANRQQAGAPATSSSASQATAAQAPRAGAKVRATIVLGSEPVSINPYGDSASFVYGMWMHLMEPLVMWNPAKGENEPVLAVAWHNPDPYTWEFKLRQGVKFHDGSDFTAADVIHSYTRIREDPGSVQKSTLEHVVAMEAPDPYTVRIHTREPDAAFLFRINNRVISSKSVWDRLGPELADRQPIGTGPYVFKEWVQGQRWVMEKNPNYWNPERQLVVDELVVRFVKEPQALVTGLLNGELDVIPNVQPQFIPQIENSGVAHVAGARGAGIMFVGMNAAHKPWDNLKLRQAVAHAIDREAIVQGILNGRGYVLTGPVGEGQYAYDPHLKAGQTYDPARARQLVREAGYPNGVDVELYTPTGRYLKDKEIAEAIVAMLGQVGIRARLQTPEWGKLWPDIQQGKVPFYYFGRGSVVDPSEYLHQYFRTGVTPRLNHSDPELDALLLAEAREFDPRQRVELLRKAMARLNETAPAAFLLQYENTYGVSNRFTFKARGDEYIFAWDLSLR